MFIRMFRFLLISIYFSINIKLISGQSLTESEQWRKDMLLGVEKVEKLAYPGRIIVFGENAQSILTGQTEEDTILAAAKYGNGRIVVFSRASYGRELVTLKNDLPNSKLYQNILKWLMGSNINPSLLKLCLQDDQNKITDLKTLQGRCNILVTYGYKETVNFSVLDAYLKSGGALIYAFTLPAWDAAVSLKVIRQIPYGQILLNSGLTYSGEYANDTKGWFYTGTNKAKDANLAELFKSTPNLESMYNKTGLLSQILELPPEYSLEFKLKLEPFWIQADKNMRNLFPNGVFKCKTLEQRQIIEFWQFLAELKPNHQFKAPYISDFPGDFEKLPKLVNKSVKYSSDKQEYFFSGAYVAAGSNALLEVTAITGIWKIFIGIHTDTLTDLPWNRWPKVIRKIELQTVGTYDISSNYGGTVVFKSPDGKTNISATILNIVQSPRYDSQDVSLQNSWEENRNLPGLWADISGKYITISLTSSNITTLENPGPVMDIYDTLIQHYHDLRGTDVNMYRKMWVVTDKQPSYGYMHAGYPIVTYLDVADFSNKKYLLNEEGLKTKTFNFWGIFHEIGHNMQQTEWTFNGTGEVTNNVYNLYGMKKIGNFDCFAVPWLNEQIWKGVKYLNLNPNFEIWKKDPGIALQVYAQLAETFNWTTYKQIFRRYQKLSIDEKPKNDQEKIDKWFIIFSEECKFNLAPLAAYWGIPLSKDATDKLDNLKFEYFLPDDIITEQTPERVQLMVEKYPNLKRN